LFRRDPLTNPGWLIPRVYAYVAYRLGDGADAEDVTGDVFEQALRYRLSYDAEKGAPLSWLIGIARRCVAGVIATRSATASALPDQPAPIDVEGETVARLALRALLATLSERDQELLALRYGADLRAREIAQLLDMETNAVEVALHRARGRLRTAMDADGENARPGRRGSRPVTRAV
jgi:RNA polymerase sigma-70 factor, ECF subfamily